MSNYKEYINNLEIYNNIDMNNKKKLYINYFIIVYNSCRAKTFI